MRNQQKQIGFFRGGFPALHPVRQLSLAEDKDLVDLQSAFSAGCIRDSKMRLTAQFEKHMNIVPVPLGQGMPLAVRFRFNDPCLGHFGKTDIQILCRLAFRRSEFQIGGSLFGASPLAGVFPVVNGTRLPTGRCDDAVSCQFPCLLSCTADKRQAKKYRYHHQQ